MPFIIYYPLTLYLIQTLNFWLDNHLSLLGFYPETWQVCKLSIHLLTLAGLSTNISVDKPANLCRCMVKS